MRAETEDGAAPAAGGRYRRERRRLQIGSDIEDRERASPRPEAIGDSRKARSMETPQIDGGAVQAVMPPERDGVSLDQFQESLQEGFFEHIAGGASIAARVTVLAGFGVAILEIAVRRRQIHGSAREEGIRFRPFDGAGRVEGLRD